jgi:hypothetical protein
VDKSETAHRFRLPGYAMDLSSGGKGAKAAVRNLRDEVIRAFLHGGPFPSRLPIPSDQWPISFLPDLQVIGNTEDAGDIVGGQYGHIFIQLVPYHALECDIAVFDDDAYRQQSHMGILVKAGI